MNVLYSFLILRCKSIPVNEGLESGSCRHQQMLWRSFFPGDSLPCAFLQVSSLATCSWAFVFSLQQMKCSSFRFSEGDYLGHFWTFHFFALKKVLDCFLSMFRSLSICTVMLQKCVLAFGRMWADNITLYTSKCSLLFLSAMTSTINTRKSVHWDLYMPMTIRSWAVPSSLHASLFPLLCQPAHLVLTSMFLLHKALTLLCTVWISMWSIR